MRLGSRATYYAAIASVALLTAALAYESRPAGAERAETSEPTIEEQASTAAAQRCSGPAWPYVDADCIVNADEAAPGAIRVISVDRSNSSQR